MSLASLTACNFLPPVLEHADATQGLPFEKILYAIGCPSLRYIDFSGCRKIHGKAILKLAENCNQISYLATESCLNITNDEIRQIAGKISQTITFLRESSDSEPTELN